MIINEYFKAHLINVSKFYRKQYKQEGLILKFICENGDELIRTYNKPKNISSTHKLSKDLRRINCNIPKSYFESTTLLVKTLDQVIAKKDYLIKVEESNNHKYPYNITDIKSID